MSSSTNESLESEGIFVGKPSKEDLINYFSRIQRLTTLKKLEEDERDSSPELSESFEIYLKEKKKKIEIEREKLASLDKNDHPATISVDNTSFNDESFLELEKMCENTLTLNNVSELLTDITTMDLMSNNPESDSREETRLFEIEQPSILLETTSLLSSLPEVSPVKKVNRPSTIMEITEISCSSYKTSRSDLQSIMTSTDKSACYVTANDKSFDSINDSSWTKEVETSVLEKSGIEMPAFNDTLDKIDFLLSQAQKISDEKASNPVTPVVAKNKKIEEKRFQKNVCSPYNTVASPKHGTTPKNSPLITFSPTVSKNTPTNFKCPKQPLSSAKANQFSKLNSKKFQHIVSPVSRYIQTSESVLNANAHVQYKGATSKRNFNFRDSENFDKSLDSSIKCSALPLRAKTNHSAINHKTNSASKTSDADRTKSNFQVFVNNTLNDTALSDSNVSRLENDILREHNF